MKLLFYREKYLHIHTDTSTHIITISTNTQKRREDGGEEVLCVIGDYILVMMTLQFVLIDCNHDR